MSSPAGPAVPGCIPGSADVSCKDLSPQIVVSHSPQQPASLDHIPNTMALEAVTRSATEQPIFTTLGIATATEHSGILLCDNISQGRGSPLGSDGLLGSCSHRFPGHRVFSIGSVKIRHDVSNEPATRVIAKVQHEIHCRLHLYISSDEIIEMCDYCSDPATEQEGIRGSSSKSWSGTIEAISRCVAYRSHIAMCGSLPKSR